MARETESHEEAQSDEETVSFAFDRMTVARFRETFPRARWSDALQAWTVPGKTARSRIDRWLAIEAARKTPYDEERGRDAYAFEPILSAYLSVYDQGFRIKTPFSRTVVDELRQIPFARWNGEEKVWEVPFASYDDLQHRWKAIEEAAKRTEEEAQAKRRSAERRKKRLPVASKDLPPLDRPVATSTFGIVVLTAVTGELVDAEEVADLHPYADGEHVWATWRAPSRDELIQTWPARTEPGDHERRRGWWLPTLVELRGARRHAQRRRHGEHVSD
jgi:hypothetical protein